MKDRLTSIFLAVAMLSCFALPVAAETVPVMLDTVSIIESDGAVYLDESYTVSLDTDPVSLQKESVEQDGVTYLFDSVSSERIPGESSEIEVKKTVVVHAETDDLAAVQAAQPQTIPYNDGGYTGTLTLDMTATEMDGPIMRETNWQMPDAGTVPLVLVSEPGNTQQKTANSKPEYVYRFLYSGTASHTEPDMLHVTVRYRAENAPENTGVRFPFAFPKITLPDWMKADVGYVYPVVGIAALGLAFLAGICALLHHRRKDVAANNDEPGDVRDQDTGGHEKSQKQKKERKPRKSEKHTLLKKESQSNEMVNASKPRMPMPEFLNNMDRSGTDTLDEEGSEQFGQRF